MSVNLKNKVCAFLALLLCAASFFSFLPQTVHAAENTLTLEHGPDIPYGNYFTNYMTVDGNTGIAYCAEPTKKTPPGGSHSYSLLDKGSKIRKALYYLQGGPGHDSVKSNYFGDLSSNEIYVVGHLAVSYLFDGESSSTDAFYGAPESLKNTALAFVHALDGMEAPNEKFQAFTIAGNTNAQTLVGCWYQRHGWVELTKSTADAKITDGNNNYSLEGAKYGIYAGDTLVETLTTDANGYAKSGDIEIGKYTIKEISASAGYKVDVNAYEVTVEVNEGTKVKVKETPQSGWIELNKATANANVSDNNINYSLKDAKYGIYFGDRQVATLVTDENGYAKSEALGIGDYTVKELSPSSGYALDVNSYGVSVKDEATSTVNVTEIPENYLVDLILQKLDLETKEAKAQGGATLEGAEFTVKYYESVSETDPAENGENATRTWVFKTDANGKIQMNAEYLVSGDDFYTDTNGKICLPIGTLTIVETKAPKGYFAYEGTTVIALPANGEVETIATVNTSEAPEQVYRGDLEFVKVADTSLKRLANVPFTITSKTTGESHTIVTDKNGYASTASSWSKHTANTNAGTSSEDGVWFGTSEPDDTKGALIYDTYEIEEQRCDANKGMDLVKFEVSVYKDSVTVQVGTLTDDFIEIGTTAVEKESGTHYAKPVEQVTIVDTVSYEGLKKGQEYKLVGTLMDPVTGEAIKDAEGNAITSETTFKTKKTSGTAEVTFTFDATVLKGKSTVVFEELYYEELVLATHADLTDEDQTIYFPEIGTTATNDKTGNHTALAEKEVTLTDVVSYTGLIPGKTYTVTGTLMDKETKEAITVDGNQVKAETEFTPEAPDGTVELHFVFDGSALAGKTVVAFESVTTDEIEVAVHADIEDQEQTIYFPGIHTTAKDQVDGDKTVEADQDVKIVDTVTYTNLTEGETYKVIGTLMDKETGKAIQIDGKDLTAEAAFTAEKADGTVDVTFTFNTKDLEGHSVVVFEKMMDANGSVIATHEDLDDEDQTVTVGKKPEEPKEETPKEETPETSKEETPKGSTVTTSGPKTGDDSNMVLWAVIAAGAALTGIGISGYAIYKRRKRVD